MAGNNTQPTRDKSKSNAHISQEQAYNPLCDKFKHRILERAIESRTNMSNAEKAKIYIRESGNLNSYPNNYQDSYKPKKDIMTRLQEREASSIVVEGTPNQERVNQVYTKVFNKGVAIRSKTSFYRQPSKRKIVDQRLSGQYPNESGQRPTSNGLQQNANGQRSNGSQQQNANGRSNGSQQSANGQRLNHSQQSANGQRSNGSQQQNANGQRLNRSQQSANGQHLNASQQRQANLNSRRRQNLSNQRIEPNRGTRKFPVQQIPQKSLPTKVQEWFGSLHNSDEIRTERAPFPIAIATLAIICTIMMMFIIYSLTQIYEYKTDINKIEHNINQLTKRETELMLELEDRNDIRIIEKIATTNIGMVKGDMVEKRFVGMSGEDKIEMIQKPESDAETKEDTDYGTASTLLSGISENFKKLMEYIK